MLKIASLGWNGSSRTWHRYEIVALLLAGLATPLVFSVHTIVSFDFATSVIPGWHTTIFPPYFVAGAIFSGLAMVLTLMLVARKVMRLEDYITKRHVGAMCKLIVGTGGIVAMAYATEFFISWYSGNPYEQFVFLNRARGPMAWAYWTMVICNVVTPQLFWFKKVRENFVIVFLCSIAINIGMWFERFVIITTSLQPRLPAVLVVDLQAYVDRDCDVYWELRALLHLLPTLLPLPSGRGDRRSQECVELRPA